MSILILVITTALLQTNLAQQETIKVVGPEYLVVTKKSWSKYYPPVGGDRDPFAPNDLVLEEQRQAREAQAANRDRIRTGDPPVRPPVLQIRTSSISDLKPGKAAYVYTIKVKNTGTKSIRQLEWAYVFSDPVTDQELGRVAFRQNVKLGSSKSTELNAYSNTPPTRVVSAKSVLEGLNERIEIYRVVFDDDSVWERPDLVVP